MSDADSILCAHAEYRETDYRFLRHRQDRLYIPLEKSEPPLVAWGPHAAAGAVLILFFLGAFLVPAIIAWVMK